MAETSWVAVASHRDSTASWIIPVLVGVLASMHVWKLPSAVEFIRAETGMTLVQSGALLGIVQVAAMLFGVVGSLVAERVGTRRTAVGGLVLFTLGSLWGGLSDQIWQLMASRALEGLGFLMVIVVGPVIVRRQAPPEQTNTAMGWWGAFQGTGVFLGVGGSALFLHGTSWGTWSQWWIFMAALSLAAIPLLLWAVEPDPVAEVNMSAAWASIRVTLSAVQPWALGLIFATYTMQWGTLIGFMPTIFADALMPEGWNVALIVGLGTAFVGALNAVGNVFAGYFLERGILPRTLLLIAFVTMLICMIGIFAPPWSAVPGGFGVQLALAALFSGVAAFIPTTLTRNAVDAAPPGGSASAVIGLVTQIFNAGNVIGPVIFTSLATAVGTWQGSWIITTALCLIGMALTLIFFTPNRSSLDPHALKESG